MMSKEGERESEEGEPKQRKTDEGVSVVNERIA